MGKRQVGGTTAEFTPDGFVDDYKAKFVNATGSSFLLLKSSATPDRVDDKLGVKYYDVEYVVRTQLGFSFDSLRSLHFLTTFAATSDSLYIMNARHRTRRGRRTGPSSERWPARLRSPHEIAGAVLRLTRACRGMAWYRTCTAAHDRSLVWLSGESSGKKK